MCHNTRLNQLEQMFIMLDAITAHILASIVGQIISMSLAIGPIVRLRTRALYGVINQRIFRSDRLALSTEVQDELNFGSITLISLMGVLFSVTRVAYSDASGRWICG